jgi:hypothetical protein
MDLLLLPANPAIEVAMSYSFSPETFHLAAFALERFDIHCAKHQIGSDEFRQMVARAKQEMDVAEQQRFALDDELQALAPALNDFLE